MMSSEISTDRSSQSPSALEPWQLFTLAGLLGATLVVLVSRGHTPAGVILLSLTIFTAAIVGIAAWRTLAPFTRGNEPERPQVLGGRTRGALEREKTLVLRAIKDLEFDRAMGKVSETDFHEMSTRLRARAARLIRQLDAGSGYREQIEREVAQRMGASATDEISANDAGVGPPACAVCGTPGDADARFCKECGARLERAS